MFKDCDQLVAVIDDQYMVQFANDACRQWLGLSEDELNSQQLRFSHAPTTQPNANGICPTPDLFDSKVQFTSHISSDKNGERVWRKASFTKLKVAESDNEFVIVVANGPDITDLNHNNDQDTTLSYHEILARLRVSEANDYSRSSLVGTSDFAKKLNRQFEAVANNSSDCLIVGPPGSGKEHLARCIFHARKNPNAILVPIHCAIADGQLIQNAIKEWVFEQKNSNTEDWLLLIDVDKLGPEAQSELLGYTQIPGFRLRLLATAENSLLTQCKEREYSQALAYHLSVQTIELEPLAQRRSDIPLLAQYFIENSNLESAQQLSGLDEDALQDFLEYPWPGNIDELKQVIELSIESCKSKRILRNDLPDIFNHKLKAHRIGKTPERTLELDKILANLEKQLLAQALTQASNNKTKAAESLSISRAKFLRRCNHFELIDRPSKAEESQWIDESEFKIANEENTPDD